MKKGKKQCNFDLAGVIITNRVVQNGK